MTAKGRFGLSLAATAVICFGFGVLRQPLAVLLVCAFALLAEKDEWLNKQAMQALLLTMAYNLIILVVGWLFGALAGLLGFAKLYSVRSAVQTLGSSLDGLIYLAFVVLSLLAIMRVLRGEDANLPGLAKLAGGDLAALLEKAPPVPYTQPQPAGPAYAAPAQPAPEPAPAPPAQPTPEPASASPAQQAPEPAYAPPAQPEPNVPPVGQCPSCSAPLQEDTRFCTECGARVG